MIKTIKSTNPANSTLTLDLLTSLEDEGILIFNITGLGPPKATVSGSGGPGFDGKTVHSVATDARHIVITLAIPSKGTSEETAKQKIYDYFPIKQEIKFEVETDTKTVYTMAIVESNEFNQFAKVENAVISLYCPNPWFIDTTEVQDLTISSSGTVVAYGGEVDTGVYAKITFSNDYVLLTGMIIYNSYGSQEMTISFTDSNRDSGDYYYIDSRIGQKSAWYDPAVGGPNINWLYRIDTDADWIRLFSGNNTLSFDSIPSAHAQLAYISLKITYSELMEGV